MAIDNVTRLRHIVEAAREAIAFAKGKSLADFESDRLLLLAVVKDLEIIGEAASKLTPELRSRYPRLPWVDIISMRNRLVHEYFGIDERILWDTVNVDLQALIKDLEVILQQEVNSQGDIV